MPTHDTGDFGIGRLGNLSALPQVGNTTIRRLLEVERLHSDPPSVPTRSPP